MVVHEHLPKNPQTSNDHQQWEDWARDASPSEVFEAFLTRMSHSRIGQPDLEPVSRLLVGRLREHLKGGA